MWSIAYMLAAATIQAGVSDTPRYRTLPCRREYEGHHDLFDRGGKVLLVDVVDI